MRNRSAIVTGICLIYVFAAVMWVAAAFAEDTTPWIEDEDGDRRLNASTDTFSVTGDLDVAGTTTLTVAVITPTTDTVPLIVNGCTTQTQHLTEWRDNSTSNTVLAYVDWDGTFSAASVTVTSGPLTTYIQDMDGDTTATVELTPDIDEFVVHVGDALGSALTNALRVDSTGTTITTPAVSMTGTLDVTGDVSTEGVLTGDNLFSCGTDAKSVGVGNHAFYSSTVGTYSTAVGYDSFAYTSSPGYDCGLGFCAGNGCSAGYNTMIGSLAGYGSLGGANVAVGLSAGYGNTNATGRNVFVGRGAGNGSTGRDNVAIGYNAFAGCVDAYAVGVGSNIGGATTSGAYNTYLGYNAEPGATTANYRTVIGANAVGTADNQVTLGRAADTVSIPGDMELAGDADITGGVTVTGTTDLNGTLNAVDTSIDAPTTGTVPLTIYGLNGQVTNLFEVHAGGGTNLITYCNSAGGLYSDLDITTAGNFIGYGLWDPDEYTGVQVDETGLQLDVPSLADAITVDSSGTTVTTPIVDVTGALIRLGSTASDPTISAVNQSPEGYVTAAPGSLCLRYDEASSETAGYLKIEGSGNTGWQPIVTTGHACFAEIYSTQDDLDRSITTTPAVIDNYTTSGLEIAGNGSWSYPSDGRITWTGSETINVLATAMGDISVDDDGTHPIFYLGDGGSASSKTRVDITFPDKSVNGYKSWSTQGAFELDQNDYIEVFCADSSTTRTVNILHYTMTVKRID